MDVKAFTVITALELDLCRCRIWIEDSNGNRIAGDKHYHDCSDHSSISSDDDDYETINFPNQTYTVHAKVQASFEKQKVRGPFNEDTCYGIYGNVDDWTFDQTSC
ncbi:uncharacterized protein OCT59_023484 [Rhizophagus irregularis]|nr:hypothetical protein GLOIN_2v1771766 [Rhizophagus irregularis DAOM 181602=DAOM 197198]EXX53460.1 hypothetical protein RirG_243710 [Rhizophagus irregularis DAOM 197198w]PKY19539.1 hypothetical protein RhiirB3_432616 [Rhizophagus irregularis]POG73987.1 hypothetical protein GLOIN_2v1771766 [Rhizophagus irregularis DAOM 181602=DAOM 197198]UZO03071.1 hypothetical protein OCT59_023484 [Rhizophagus irregularis]CAB4473964.1 unnamed protein product [Rhizophagus irregularis]|eukprot:XP_025180853.1 hypothetical protein GLOIN_2v1771766 [Rhizophagus irregularis DAOM 181602=DAOM 197198]